MFVSDLREDFFKPLRSHRRVLILVHLDVDAVCAAKILISLLQCDQVFETREGRHRKIFRHSPLL